MLLFQVLQDDFLRNTVQTSVTVVPEIWFLDIAAGNSTKLDKELQGRTVSKFVFFESIRDTTYLFRWVHFRIDTAPVGTFTTVAWVGFDFTGTYQIT